MQKTDIKAIFKAKIKASVLADITIKTVTVIIAVLIILYSSFDRLFSFGQRKTGDRPTPDELEAGADELPPAYRDIIFQKEYPMALGIYDTLFSDESITVPKGELKITETDLSKNPMPDQIYFKNNTSYSLNISSYLTAADHTIDVSAKGETITEPLVLIYHTHGTEGYAEEGKTSYSASSLPRSTDITENVVAVGKLLCDILNENGIPTLHCEIMHDNGSYNTAYTKSAKTVKEYLEKYPSIKYAFDIHRDALVGETVVYKTLTYDESTPIAQLMFVVGTNSSGADHDDWERNLSFAVNAQHFLIKRLNNIVRPISIKKSAYNQQYPHIGTLIEVGTCVNTLSEAKAATVILGDILSGMILSDIPLYNDIE